MTLLPFRKPPVKALLPEIPDVDRKAFIADLLNAAIEMESDKDAVGFAVMILHRDSRRTFRWNTAMGSGRSFERAFRRSIQEIAKYLQEKGG